MSFWTRRAVPLVLVRFGFPALAAPPRDVAFIVGARTEPVRAAIEAIQQDGTLKNVPISVISAALIDLNGDGSPELLVKLGSGYCRSLGCATMVFERSTDGWMKIGDWVVGPISVPETVSEGWHDLVLDHDSVWRHHWDGYRLSNK